MTAQTPRDDVRLSVPLAPATSRQRRVALAFCLANACAAIVIGAIGLVPLARIDGFIPAVQSIMTVTDFITAVLLFAQYASERSQAILVLAGGYLFTALIIAAQTLTFPGAFTPGGLLGAGPQTAAWLYLAWHLSLPAAALGYALLKPQELPTTPVQGAAGIAIRRTVIGVILGAALLTWAVIATDDWLPTLVVSETAFSSTASSVTVIALAVTLLAFLFVWRRRTSVLDEWLLVALSAFVAEAPIIVFLGASRYTSAFYSSRLLALVASCAVLVALLSEMTRLYVRLSTAVKALQRERAAKLMNLDVVVSSIGHEIRQPLTVIRMSTSVIDALLRKPRIEVDEVRENLDEVASSAVRIAETIDGLRGLFRNRHEDEQRLDINQLLRECLHALSAELAERRIVLTCRFAPETPHVVGHKGQLREVFVNIVQNAIDAMTPVTDRPRQLDVATSDRRDRLLVTIQDSGPGIESDRLPTLFTAHISTKASGMGLGLSICQMIVDRHDGQLAVSSELGKGTCFEVSLPAEQPSASTLRLPPDQPTARGTKPAF